MLIGRVSWASALLASRSGHRTFDRLGGHRVGYGIPCITLTQKKTNIPLPVANQKKGSQLYLLTSFTNNYAQDVQTFLSTHLLTESTKLSICLRNLNVFR